MALILLLFSRGQESENPLLQWTPYPHGDQVDDPAIRDKEFLQDADHHKERRDRYAPALNGKPDLDCGGRSKEKALWQFTFGQPRVEQAR
jgi:hypothetical protein